MPQFAVTGVAVINKIKVSAAAQKQLRNLVVKIDTTAITGQLNKIQQQLKGAFAPLNKIAQAGGGLNKVATGFNNVNKAVKGANKSVTKQKRLLEEVIKKASAFRVSTTFINAFFNSFSNGLRFLIEFDSRLRNINKVVRLNDADLTSFGGKLIQIAKEFNLSAEEVADAARTAAQAGLAGPDANANEKAAAAIQLANKAAIAAASSTLTFGQSVESLLTIQKQLGISTEEASVVLGKFSAIEDAAAVDAQALSVVFQKAGTSIGLAFGDNVDKATGAIAALLERTRQTPQVVGTFFKTLSARLSGANKDALDAVKNAGTGIDLTDQLGNLKDPIELLTELKEELKGLSDIAQGEVLGKVFGIRQAELGKALLATLGETGQAVKLADAAQGSYLKQIIKVQQEVSKYEAQLNSITQTFNEFVNLMRDDVFKPFIDGLTKVGQAAKSIGIDLEFLKDLLPLAAVAGAAGISKTLGISASFAAFRGKDQDPQQQANATAAKLGPNPFAVGAGKGVGFKGFRAGLGKAISSVKQFSGAAIGTSLVLNLLGPQISDLTSMLGDELGGAVDGVISTFATLIIAGGPIALLGAGAVAVYKSLNVLSDTYKLHNDDLRQASEYLSKIAGTEGSVEDLNRAAAADVLVQDAGGAEAKKLQQQFVALVSDINDATKGFQAAIFGITGDTEEGARAIRDATQATNQVILEKLQELEKASPGAIQALQGTAGGESLLSQDKFLRLFGDELRGGLEPLVQSLTREGGGAGAVAINTVLAELVKNQQFSANVEKATKGGVTNSALDNELIKRREDEIAANNRLVESVDKLLSQEIKLFAARGSSGLQAVQALTFLEEELAEKRVASAKAARERTEADKLDPILQQIEAHKKNLTILQAENSALKNVGRGFGESGKAIDTVIKEIEKLNAAYKAQAADINSAEEVQAANAEVAAAELNLVSIRLKGQAEIATAFEAFTNKQITAARETADATLALADAEQKLANFRSGTNVLDIAQQGLEKEKLSAGIALASIDEQIQLQRQLQASAKTARAEVQAAVNALSESLKTRQTGEGQAELSGQLENAKKTLAIREKLENESSQKTLDLINKRTVVELQGRAKVLAAVLKTEQAERGLRNERLDTASQLIRKTRELKDVVRSIFDAQLNLSNTIRDKLAEAGDNIKSKRGGLDQAYSSLAGARDALISALKEGANAFADYTLAINQASVAADKIMGVFFGLRDQASALATAYDASIEAAKAAGASETKLAELRTQAAEQQLQLYQQLLSDTQSKAEQFFVSSGEDRAEFVQGLAGLQSIADSFGGNIENFRGLDENALNEFGANLINLPQSVRQGLLGALDQLPDGVGIGGLTADELKEVLLGGALGESEEVGIETLSDTMQTVADLTLKVAESNVSQLIAAQSSLAELKAAVSEAKEGVRIAKAMLSQAKQDALRTQQAIAQVNSTLNTQIGQYREEFKAQADIIAAKFQDDPQGKVNALQGLEVEFRELIAGITTGVANAIGNVGPDSQLTQSTVQLPFNQGTQSGASGDVLNTIQKGISEGNLELKAELGLLNTTVRTVWTDNINENTAQMKTLADELIKANSRASETAEASAEININNTQTLNIKGGQEIVDSIMSTLDAQGFLKEVDVADIRATLIKLVNANIESTGRGALGL